MRTFRTYKPSRESANFLEIRHEGTAWMQKLAARDAANQLHNLPDADLIGARWRKDD